MYLGWLKDVLLLVDEYRVLHSFHDQILKCDACNEAYFGLHTRDDPRAEYTSLDRTVLDYHPLHV